MCNTLVHIDNVYENALFAVKFLQRILNAAFISLAMAKVFLFSFYSFNGVKSFQLKWILFPVKIDLISSKNWVWNGVRLKFEMQDSFFIVKI